MVRRLSMLDPAFRYAEHRALRSFYDAEIFYYQGTDFIEGVEELLKEEMAHYLGCREVEARVISGQMANAVVFSALVDYLNRNDGKAEPRRIRSVLNNHMIRGGHLSAQPLGALFNFVRIDPRTEKSAVVNFPVLAENPYKTDLEATRRLIDEQRPELIIFGKSMVLHREPVREIRDFLREQGIEAVVLYDMAHVLGWRDPASRSRSPKGRTWSRPRRTRPSSARSGESFPATGAKTKSNTPSGNPFRTGPSPAASATTHLGTLLGLLMAAYEMNRFRDDYQPAVIRNAKAFASALRDAGLRWPAIRRSPLRKPIRSS